MDLQFLLHCLVQKISHLLIVQLKVRHTHQEPAYDSMRPWENGARLSGSLGLSLAAGNVTKDMSKGVGDDPSLLWWLLLSLHCEGLPCPGLSICKYCTYIWRLSKLSYMC